MELHIPVPLVNTMPKEKKAKKPTKEVAKAKTKPYAKPTTSSEKRVVKVPNHRYTRMLISHPRGPFPVLPLTPPREVSFHAPSPSITVSAARFNRPYTDVPKPPFMGGSALKGRRGKLWVGEGCHLQATKGSGE